MKKARYAFSVWLSGPLTLKWPVRSTPMTDMGSNVALSGGNAGGAGGLNGGPVARLHL